MYMPRQLNHGVVGRQHHLTRNSVQRIAHAAFLFSFLLLLRTFDQALLATTDTRFGSHDNPGQFLSEW